MGISYANAINETATTPIPTHLNILALPRGLEPLFSAVRETQNRLQVSIHVSQTRCVLGRAQPAHGEVRCAGPLPVPARLRMVGEYQHGSATMARRNGSPATASEGQSLLNGAMHRFMGDYDDKLERATRDCLETLRISGVPGIIHECPSAIERRGPEIVAIPAHGIARKRILRRRLDGVSGPTMSMKALSRA